MPVATAGPGSPGLGCVGLAPAARCSHLPKVRLIFQLLKRQVRFAEQCLRAEVSGYPLLLSLCQGLFPSRVCTALGSAERSANAKRGCSMSCA